MIREVAEPGEQEQVLPGSPGIFDVVVCDSSCEAGGMWLILWLVRCSSTTAEGRRKGRRFKKQVVVGDHFYSRGGLCVLGSFVVVVT